MTDDERPSQPPSLASSAHPAKGRRDHIWLIVALAGSAGLAILARRAPDAAQRPVSAATASRAPEAAAERAPGDEASTTISGRVVERIDVPNYTYLSLDIGQGAARTWVAVSSSGVQVGERVRVVDAQLMTNFTSTTLERTFDTIYFGALDDGSALPSSGAEVAHWVQRGEDPHAGVPGAPPLGPGASKGSAQNPHGNVSEPSRPLTIGQVAKAEGSSGRTVAETHAQRSALAGRTVRVRAVVVKVISGVLERSFVHVKDGSENGEIRDLLITTRATPAVGDRVLFEGKVTVDKDFGAGYTYPVLLEDAELVADPGTPSATL